jgi:E3 ubiquitin-protein ligase BRE1
LTTDTIQANLEKQLAEMRTTQQTLLVKNREYQTRIVEHNNTIDSLKSQVAELSTFLKARDAAVSKESSGRREAEIEVEKLHVKLEDLQRSLENNKPKGGENSQLEALRVCFHPIKLFPIPVKA